MSIKNAQSGFLMIELLIAVSSCILLTVAISSAIGLVSHWSAHAQKRMDQLLAAQEIMTSSLQKGRRSITVDCTVTESIITIPDFYSPRNNIALQHVVVTPQNNSFTLCSGVARE